MVLTDWVIILITAISLIFDVYIMKTKGVSYTISVRLFKWSKDYPVIPFAIGFLMGHLFA